VLMRSAWHAARQVRERLARPPLTLNPCRPRRRQIHVFSRGKVRTQVADGGVVVKVPPPHPGLAVAAQKRVETSLVRPIEPPGRQFELYCVANLDSEGWLMMFSNW
jgi:hypothetical protein